MAMEFIKPTRIRLCIARGVFLKFSERIQTVDTSRPKFLPQNYCFCWFNGKNRPRSSPNINATSGE